MYNYFVTLHHVYCTEELVTCVCVCVCAVHFIDYEYFISYGIACDKKNVAVRMCPESNDVLVRVALRVGLFWWMSV